MLNYVKIHSEKPLPDPVKLTPRLFTVVATSVLLLSLSTSAEALTVTRGPYLQSGSTSGVIVKWRTDSSSNAIVNYGTNAANLNLTAVQSGSSRDHEVTISGLQPDTKYFYSVGSDSQTLAGGNSDYFFTTSPDAGTTKSFRIWAVGDSGTANSDARRVRDAYKNFTGAQGTDLMLMLGDNAYNDGKDSEYQRAVFDMYPNILRNTVLWSTLGNHDGHSTNSSKQSGPYYDIFSFPRNGEAGGVPSGTEAYYSFDYGNIHFIVLESYQTNRSTGGAMMKWLADDAAATDKDWLVAFWHHPPYTKGSHDSDNESQLIEMRENALPILEANGVDLVLSGHSHSYERSFLIDGHYGKSGSLNNTMVVDGGDGNKAGDGAYEKSGGLMGNEGAVYIVAGSSGKRSGVSKHRAMRVAMSTLGSVVMDVEGNRMDVRFLDDRGNSKDNFTLLKGGGGTNLLPPVANAGSNQIVEKGTTVILAGSGSDPDGTIAAYQWSQVSGTPVVLSNSNTATASFTAPDAAKSSVRKFKLMVTDNDGLNASDQVSITVNNTTTGNLPPVANAGPNQTVKGSAPVVLIGSGSDPDGTIAAYQWSQVSGPSVIFLANPNSATAGFTAPKVAAQLIFNLAVTDNGGLTANDRVTIKVRGPSTGGDADLVVDKLVYKGMKKGFGTVGKKLKVITKVSNRGNEAASNSKLMWVLSPDSVIDTSDLQLGQLRNVRKLTSGSIRMLKGSFKLPATVVPGTYYLGAVVDTENAVVESNEANNTAAVKIEVKSQQSMIDDDD